MLLTHTRKRKYRSQYVDTLFLKLHGVTSIGDIVSQRTDVIHTESKYSMQNVLSNVLANMDDGGEFIQPQL